MRLFGGRERPGDRDRDSAGRARIQDGPGTGCRRLDGPIHLTQHRRDTHVCLFVSIQTRRSTANKRDVQQPVNYHNCCWYFSFSRDDPTLQIVSSTSRRRTFLLYLYSNRPSPIARLGFLADRGPAIDVS